MLLIAVFQISSLESKIFDHFSIIIIPIEKFTPPLLDKTLNLGEVPLL